MHHCWGTVYNDIRIWNHHLVLPLQMLMIIRMALLHHNYWISKAIIVFYNIATNWWMQILKVYLIRSHFAFNGNKANSKMIFSMSEYILKYAKGSLSSLSILLRLETCTTHVFENISHNKTYNTNQETN